MTDSQQNRRTAFDGWRDPQKTPQGFPTAHPDQGPPGVCHAAQPMRGPADAHGGPPPEASEACIGKKAGDDCVIRRDEWEMKGTCTQGPVGGQDSRSACAPSRPKGPPSSNDNDRGGARHPSPTEEVGPVDKLLPIV